MNNAKELLDIFQNTMESCIAPSTIKAYESHYKTYLNIITQIKGADPPEPVSERNIKLFLGFRKSTGISYNTIMADITSIGYYCRKNGWKDVTDLSFIQQFKKGTRRMMLAGTNPNAKTPISKNQLIRLASVFDPKKFNDFQTFAHIFIQYYGILRVSEVIQLKNKDFSFFEDRVVIHIVKTKTDQIGVGRQVTIHKDNEIPILLDIIKNVHKENDPEGYYLKSKNGCSLSKVTLRRRFMKILMRAGITNDTLSTHLYAKEERIS